MQIELTQSPERYSYKSGVWKISAKSDIKPIEIIEGSETLDVTPLLSVGGVIVHIMGTEYYLGSEELIQNLADSFRTNPHYSYKKHSNVLGAVMGRTIPILEVKIDKIEESIMAQKEKGKFAVTPLDENKRIPEDTLAQNLKTINDRIIELKKDFKTITDTFYFGITTPTSTTTYDVLASAEGEEFSVQVVTKDSVMVSKVATPLTQTAEAQSEEVAEVKSDVQTQTQTLQQRISNNEETIKAAQSGDAVAQKALGDANAALREQLKTLQDKYLK